MPLFYQHNINESTRLAVWHIEEDENFFLERVELQKKISHPHKRLQHLAGRYLLQLLDPDFPVHSIEIGDSSKPLLADASFHFSISHCGDYAAAIISTKTTVGIDIEMITPRIDFIKSKFLSPEELRLLPTVSDALLTVLWSSKEAIYKWYGKGGIDFVGHMRITDIKVHDTEGEIHCEFSKGKIENLRLYCHLFGEKCLAWLVH